MSRPSASSETIPSRRRLSLWVLGLTSRLFTRAAGRALGGFPGIAGFPVLLGGGDPQLTRARLATALARIAEYAPGRYRRMQRHLLGLFVARQPRSHGHYSRITGTCALDVDLLAAAEPLETAALLVRAATEAWLWQAGRGRSAADEEAVLRLAERCRRQFLDRMSRPQVQAA